MIRLLELLHSLSSFEGMKPQKLHSPVAIARRSHPYPYRTRKLSFSAPMVVRGCPLVRVGRCRAIKRVPNWYSFLYIFVYFLLIKYWYIKNGPFFDEIFKKERIKG